MTLKDEKIQVNFAFLKVIFNYSFYIRMGLIRKKHTKNKQKKKKIEKQKIKQKRQQETKKKKKNQNQDKKIERKQTIYFNFF